MSRLFCAAGGLAGATGLLFYALAAHTSGYYGTLAPILLGQAPLLVFLGLTRSSALLPCIGGMLVVLGLVFFTTDLMFRQLAGLHLFPFAAPIGGISMIAGWLAFVPFALLSKFPSSNRR